jgi:hypothetical protein
MGIILTDKDFYYIKFALKFTRTFILNRKNCLKLLKKAEIISQHLDDKWDYNSKQAKIEAETMLETEEKFRL